MSTTEDNNNTTVSFATEEAPITRKASSELRHAKDHASLSQSAKAWDLDGDGELDETEMALRNMDTSHKGTLSKEQMYKLMGENLQTQRELFKVKKVVIGLVVFTCILAISNLGTSLAAAFLAKDTKSENDALVDASTGRTLATDSTTAVFEVDPEFDQQFSRRRRKLCDSAGQGGINCELTSFTAVDFDKGHDIITKCNQAKGVTIEMNFGSDLPLVRHTICPYTTSTPSGGEGNGRNTTPLGLIIHREGVEDVSIQHDSGAYTITGLKSPENGACVDDIDCVSGTTCDSNACTVQAVVAAPAPLIPAGGTCTTTTDCEDHHVCEAPSYWPDGPKSCICDTDDACDGGFVCSEGNGGKWCRCAVGSCPNDVANGGDQLCTNECAIGGDPVCTTQAAMDADCAGIYGAGYYCPADRSACIAPLPKGEEGTVLATPGGGRE